ncbi:endonuclease/exonuclease/phosphatase family protein [Dyadobacter sp. CY323]|uniref:endonuclease/exonuclease/phosphatase family protein n=1 Tax=Dyadobacter sp. CY323 TaxID=2907302 RepID=UPI001F46FB90|nr:endonuclease/exonuclease/phosphatase family protein [Dyadobacter sp. CY323]MCE6992591.1 endonuclease/exonuclease/phosphatase family protein [Dyadobacter sp. CY323]
MKGIKNFLWFLYKCFAFCTLLIYILIFWIPFDGWLAGFVMMSFPVLILVHLISVPIWFLIDRKRALLPVVVLAFGCLFLPRTYKFGDDVEPDRGNPGTFSVMGYNTHTFMRNLDVRDAAVKKEIGDMKSWLAGSGADILCMPEYFEDRSKLFNLAETLEKAGYLYSNRFNYPDGAANNYYSGLILFSKHPIVHARDTIFESQNGMVQADIKIGSDTVRVVAVHLYSMTLNLSKLAHQKQIDGIKQESKITFRRMKDGFKQRSKEIKILKTWTKDSPYPVIVCGDFNEVPYGYVYGELGRDMKNSFEEKGDGFGFTFNHLPYFIRIDHQFYSSDKLDLLDFKTRSDIKFSDHYPIMGTYQFR